MKRLFNKYKVPALIIGVCLSLMSLMAFQVSWLTTSKRLIQEQFDQKVNLAIGSALADFNSRHEMQVSPDGIGRQETEIVVREFNGETQLLNKESRDDLMSTLSSYMACYGIEKKYRAEIFSANCNLPENAYCCSIATAGNSNGDYNLGVSFLSRDDYLFDRMKFMIASSILIFILLSAISMAILKALIQQKRITENNIDFF